MHAIDAHDRSISTVDKEARLVLNELKNYFLKFSVLSELGFFEHLLVLIQTKKNLNITCPISYIMII